MASLRNALVKMMLRLSRKRNSRLDLNRFRQEFESIFAALCPVPKQTTVETVSLGGFNADWIGVEGATPERFLLFLHGGAFVFGSARTHRGFAAKLSHAVNAKALVVDYRRAPEHTYPQALEDSLSAYRYLIESGISPKQVCVFGDSAGASLGIQLIDRLKAEGSETPAKLVLLSPWVDLSCSTESYETNANRDPMLDRSKLLEWARMYAGEADLASSDLSPINIDFAGFPPTWIGVSSDELFLSEAQTLAENMRRDRVDVQLHVEQGVTHVWPLFYRLVPEARRTVQVVSKHMLLATTK